VAIEIDPELAIEAILLHVSDLNGTAGTGGTHWLEAEFRRVLASYLEGDIFVNATSFEGSSAQSQSRVPSGPLLAVLTQCRKRLAGGGISDNQGAMLIPRFGEFPL
jgi:hypothetical protein